MAENDELKGELTQNRIASLKRHVASLEKEKRELKDLLGEFQRVATKIDKTHPFYYGDRKTPVRKLMDFSKEEMEEIRSLIGGEMAREIPFNDHQKLGELYNRFLDALSVWEDEAFQNGEFF